MWGDDGDVVLDDIDEYPFHDPSLPFRTLGSFVVVSSPATGAIFYPSFLATDSDFTLDLRTIMAARMLDRRDLNRVRKELAPTHQIPSTGARSETLYQEAVRVAKKHMRHAGGHFRPGRAHVSPGRFAAAVALQRLRMSLFAAHLLQ